VIGEGGGMLVLEELEHALARGARIHAEIVGFGSNADGQHTTRPEQVTMRRAMELALEDAGLKPEAIGYVNGHGTATEQGDIAETLATSSLFGEHMPISSQKSFLGHTRLRRPGIVVQHRNDEPRPVRPHAQPRQVDPHCGELDYLRGEFRAMSHEYVMNNNFAFGGVNTSLISAAGPDLQNHGVKGMTDPPHPRLAGHGPGLQRVHQQAGVQRQGRLRQQPEFQRRPDETGDRHRAQRPPVDRPVGAPGHGQGGHHRARRHHAEVDIPYSPTEFQIVYRSSWGLDYKDGKIHGNYNRWINRLRDNVLKELSFNPDIEAVNALGIVNQGVDGPTYLSFREGVKRATEAGL
jgi:hypothetical protein